MVSSCIDAPMFDDIPEISNPRIQLSSNPLDVSITGGDSVMILFDFKDGNGDLGYDIAQDGIRTIETTSIFDTTVTIDSTLETELVIEIDSITMDTTTTIDSSYVYDTMTVINETILSDTFIDLPDHVFLRYEEFDTFFTQYTIPRIPMIGGVPDITGTVKIFVPTSTGSFFGPCISNPQISTVTYSVFIKDRGRESKQYRRI